MSAKIHIDDEADYAEAVRELAGGTLREGLWAKVLVESDGDRERAKILYLKYRVALIKEERKHSVEQSRRAEQEASIAAKRHADEQADRFFRTFPEAKQQLSERHIQKLMRRFANGEDVRGEIERAVASQREFESWVWRIVIGFCIVLGALYVSFR